MRAPLDVLGIAARPDDFEAAMGGTAAKLAAAGMRVLFADLTDGEPSRHAALLPARFG